MNIMLVSQCSKQALPRTRRILDQFAERKGNRTWLTPITEIGLETLQQLLRQQARRNTAVACHRVRGNKIELLWIVGNRKKFNQKGSVPTDTRKHSVLNDIKEDKWQYAEGIALLAAIAGLFHDFGKANLLFQEKLKKSSAPKSEPIRHEWLSVRIFQAFVGDRTDQQWLEALKNIQNENGATWIDEAVKDGLTKVRSPLHVLKDRQVALAVCWLILTHHKLPYKNEIGAASGDEVDLWIRNLSADWNSPQFTNEHHDKSALMNLWTFEKGLPIESKTWRDRAENIAERALGYPDFMQVEWFESTFCLHMARCALMLADHSYSSANSPTERWQDDSYHVFANTKKSPKDGKRVFNQKLDEHCIGVAHYAFLFAKNLPKLRNLLPAIGDVRSLRKHSKGRFSWQNKAFSMTSKVKQASEDQGGFFVNMASTGTGKTIANARMAYGLSNENDGCRFNVLLGLRTLTLQTGTALQERIGLERNELATLVGSNIVRKLHENTISESNGSESAEPLVGDKDKVYYEGEITQSKFGEWLDIQNRQSIRKLISAPVLVSTIDYLMPATESSRGGRQLAPMMRLLSSDIVLDEPDDFGLEDQPALCRLVYWAGMLGSRVILSSATLSPALLEALFSAYRAGRAEYQQSVSGNTRNAIVCGWVDEHSAESHQVGDVVEFVANHDAFIDKRLRYLKKEPPRRLAALLPIEPAESHEKAMAKAILSGALMLHRSHGISQEDGDNKISIGLVRMANIKPLVAVAKELVAIEPDSDTEINLCIYHSRHPLLRRHLIEKNLDALLSRFDTKKIWQHSTIRPALNRKAKNQIFIVLATAVAEVGRDHCYDWAIVEPSSMRSIVQLAGRVLRHREPQPLQQPNMLLLEKNFRALQGHPIAFTKPGYESDVLNLEHHELIHCLPFAHYQHPSPRSCISESNHPEKTRNMVDMEHVGMRAKLLTNSSDNWPASLWWKDSVRWAYQMQAKTGFRKGMPSILHALVTDYEGGDLGFEQFFNGEWVGGVNNNFNRETVNTAIGMHWWITPTDQELIDEIIQTNRANEDDELDMEYQCRSLLTVDLDDYPLESSSVWNYHEILGIFKSL